MNGIICIYKESGYTSFHVIAVLKRLTREKKIGHTGTLDPDATGILPVCLGKATKIAGVLTDTDKVYRAVMKFGIRTDTQDVSGSVLEEMPEEKLHELLDDEKILNAISKFQGEIMQIPPMYSALKVDGVKLVDAAREGKEIERKPRLQTIYGYKNVDINLDELTVSFDVKCSKGTYIRTLCQDIGESLGVPACLKSLERVEAAGLNVSQCISLDEAAELAKTGQLESRLIPVDQMLTAHRYLVLNEDGVKKVLNGNFFFESDLEKEICIDLPGSNPGQTGCEGIYRIYDKNKKFYALYEFKDGAYVSEKMFI